MEEALENPGIIEIQDINFSSEDKEEEVQVHIVKRYIRDNQNPFEFYHEWEFKRRFRFSKESVMFGILPLVEDGLKKTNNRGLPISPVIQLLVCLRFYSSASFQLIVDDVSQISQPAISRIVYRISVLIASYINRYIKMPVSDEACCENRRLFKERGYGPRAIGLPCIDGAIDCTHIRLVHTRFQAIDEVFRNRKGYFSLNVQVFITSVSDEACCENRRLFKERGYGPRAIGLPCIDGAIDCTHIRLVHTRFQAIDEVFRNRKGYFSLNVQAIVGPRTEFLDIVPEWPGSEHDSRIFQNSRIYVRYRQQDLDGMLVGDGGYPALPFLLTPIANPITDEEISYNMIHARTRVIVERTFGIWKRRFACLSRGLSTKLITSTTIVMACAVLHNLSLIFNDTLEEEEEEIENINEDEKLVPLMPHWQPGDGLLMRTALIERLFR